MPYKNPNTVNVARYRGASLLAEQGENIETIIKIIVATVLSATVFQTASVHQIEEIKPIEPIQVELKEPAEIISELPTPPTTVDATSEELMTLAGIPKSDWYYVDCVINGCEGVSPEGGWHGTERWNETGSGAYGICQALPASKMSSAGSDYMTNTLTQLKWCHSYAMQYGGWKEAWEFRKCLGNCYSSRINATTNKDHTWW